MHSLYTISPESSHCIITFITPVRHLHHIMSPTCIIIPSASHQYITYFPCYRLHLVPPLVVCCSLWRRPVATGPARLLGGAFFVQQLRRLPLHRLVWVGLCACGCADRWVYMYMRTSICNVCSVHTQHHTHNVIHTTPHTKQQHHAHNTTYKTTPCAQHHIQINHTHTHPPQLHPKWQSGMLSFARNLQSLTNREWLIQLPLILVVAAAAGALGAVYNTLRRWLWRVRASRRKHALRYGVVLGG